MPVIVNHRTNSMHSDITSPDTGSDLPFQAVCASRRDQPYRLIHKGLRVLLAQAQQAAGQCDVRDAEERARLVDSVESALAVCCDHLAHENRFFHEPLRARAPRAVMPFEHDHQEHLQAIAQLRLLLLRVRDAGASGDALAYELYLRFSRFVGENLAHMAEEETTLTQALWDHFDDGEILAMSDSLRAALSPEENSFYLTWMARGLNNAELHALLSGARGGLPAPVFEQLSALALAQLPPTRRERLAAELEASA